LGYYREIDKINASMGAAHNGTVSVPLPYGGSGVPVGRVIPLRFISAHTGHLKIEKIKPVRTYVRALVGTGKNKTFYEQLEWLVAFQATHGLEIRASG
jgi:hypothetical protein